MVISMDGFLVDFIFTLCEILIVISYLFRNILLLRIVTIFGMLGYVIGGFVAGLNTPGMKAIIIFSTMAVLINIIQSGKLILEQIPILLPNQLKEIYKNNFQIMTTNEFFKITKFSSTKQFRKNEIITTENQPVPTLSLIIQGTVTIIKNNIEISRLSHGYFIGEMSFLTNEDANATVIVASEKIEMMQWKKEDLYRLQNENFSLFNKLKHAIAINLIKKIDLNTIGVKH